MINDVYTQFDQFKVDLPIKLKSGKHAVEPTILLGSNDSNSPSNDPNKPAKDRCECQGTSCSPILASTSPDGHDNKKPPVDTQGGNNGFYPPPQYQNVRPVFQTAPLFLC